ncbi:MAG: hypothetical protein OXR72_05170, partial [Gemmatimonadota bacterium]|nr:hypothetical protein [Gemmatimonadota bacterium]
TFGSFWSLQKEHAVGRELGEMWMLSQVFAFIFLRQPEAMRRGRGHGTDINGLRLCFKLTADRCLLIFLDRRHPALVALFSVLSFMALTSTVCVLDSS